MLRKGSGLEKDLCNYLKAFEPSEQLLKLNSNLFFIAVFFGGGSLHRFTQNNGTGVILAVALARLIIQAK